MDEKAITTLKAQVKEIHNDPSSAMYQYTQGGKVLNVIWDLSNSEITEKWEISVKNLQESN